jgi:hypothetical protein
MEFELKNGAIKVNGARSIDVSVHTSNREADTEALFWGKEYATGAGPLRQTTDEYISLRTTIKEEWYEATGDAPPAEAGSLVQFLSIEQAREQVRGLTLALSEHDHHDHHDDHPDMSGECPLCPDWAAEAEAACER